MEILIGLLIIAVGSFGQSSSYVPIRKVRDWSWESFWLVQGIFAWIVFPWLGASLALPEGVTLGALWAAGGAWAVGLLRRAVGCRGTDLRPVDALSGRGARTVDRTGYLRSVRHALPRAAGGAESLPRRGAGAVAGRLHHAGGHRRDRLCRFAAFASAQRRGAPCGGEGFRTDQGVAGGAAGPVR